MFETNEVLQKLPKHLKSLIIEQPYNDYTAQDHAIWRYVMRQNIHYLKEVAHESYLSGLEKTGISIEEIPHMYGMNRILKDIGWAAVAVDGFIPPSAFMEFQAYNVLVIAADIRPLDQIGYTPAPDIIHEAAGHAPIIANKEYSEYLRLFGKYGCKAFSSPKDKEMYLAIRHLSILKTDPYTDAADITKAEEKIKDLENNMSELSELSMLRNLHWWTVEYGLIGDLSNPKIYGAGLLSSINESKNAISENVKKLPYNFNTMKTSFDITEMQPQLFVTPNFKTLTEILEKYVDTMALRRGGLAGIQKAIDSESIACIVYNSGLQVSGKFASVTSADGVEQYIQTSGPTSLSYEDTELNNHSTSNHKDGFGSPIGKIKNISENFHLLSNNQLSLKGFNLDELCEFEFESGVKVKGILINILRKNSKVILMSFTNCVVTHDNHILFFPEWGTYDMAVGDEIVSVFNGPADHDNYGHTFDAPSEKTHKIEHTEKAKKLHKLYQNIRDNRTTNTKYEDIINIWIQVKNNYPNEWLLCLEILEITDHKKEVFRELKEEVQQHLIQLSISDKSLEVLISNGLKSIQKTASVS